MMSSEMTEEQKQVVAIGNMILDAVDEVDEELYEWYYKVGGKLVTFGMPGGAMSIADFDDDELKLIGEFSNRLDSESKQKEDIPVVDD